LPNSDDFIKNFEDQDVFLKMKGKLRVFKCTKVKSAKNLDDYEIELVDSTDERSVKYYLKDLIIRPKTIYLSISNNLDFRNSEVELIKWMINNQTFSYIYLKKPVNNLEIGKIQQVNFDRNKLKQNSGNKEQEAENNIVVKNIFGKEIDIEYNSLELITFEYDTAMMQLKSETSMFSRLGYKILHKLKPRSIFYVNN